MEVPQPFIDVLKKYQSSFTFTSHGPTFEHDGKNATMVAPGGTTCHVVDNATKKIYISEQGISRSDAMEKAIAKVPVTAKPLTEAQRETANQINAAVSAKEDELRAKIAELESKLAAKTSTPRREHTLKEQPVS